MTELVEIDGSYGEGGGQILRSSIALSALTLKPIRVFNIRAKRSNPGLRPQHMTAIKAVATLTKAKVKGLYKGSMDITFNPEKRLGGYFRFDIGTAGSISLVLQALLPAAAFAIRPCTFEIIGGTDVMKAPPIDYVRFVLLPWLRKFGYEVSIELRRRGHYPRGGGRVIVRTMPVKVLKAIRATERGSVVQIKGISHAVRLPSHVAIRQAKAAEDILKKAGYDDIEINIEWYPPNKDPHLGPGSAVVLWAITDRGFILGADSLGARGKPAEVVGKEAAEKLLSELKTGACADRHMGDMLIPFMAVAKGTSEISVSSLTLHTITNIHVTEKILGIKFDIHGKEGEPGRIKVHGLGLMNRSS